MEQENLFDIIIIGASEEGTYLAEKLSSKVNKRIAIIDYNFGDKLNSCFDADHIKTIQQKVSLITFLRGLYLLSLDGGKTLVAYNLVIATGKKSQRTNLGVGEYVNDRFKLNNEDKNSVLVYGDGKDYSAVDIATRLANRFEKVYLDTPNFIAPSPHIDNVQHINGAKIIDKTYRTSPTGVKYLASVSLDNYAKISCRAIVYRDNFIPEIPAAREGIIKLDDKGLIIVNKDWSLVSGVPNAYAIGTCTNDDILPFEYEPLADRIIEKNKWKEI